MRMEEEGEERERTRRKEEKEEEEEENQSAKDMNFDEYCTNVFGQATLKFWHKLR